MIAHLSIGVRDLERSKGFYDSALAPLGYKCLRPGRTMLGYGYGSHNIAFWIVSAERPVPADEKSGLHVCFVAPSAEAVCLSRGSAARGRAGQRCARSPPGLRSRLLCRLHHRSGWIPDRGVLRPARSIGGLRYDQTVSLSRFGIPHPGKSRPDYSRGQLLANGRPRAWQLGVRSPRPRPAFHPRCGLQALCGDHVRAVSIP